MNTTVQVSGLTKRYRAVTALDQVSLELTAGRVHLLVGPNGAGKTTLLRALAGLVRPTEGSVTILGRPFSSVERPARVVGACLDPIRLPALRSGRQHLACLATAAGLPHQRVGEVLEIVGLPAQVAAHSLTELAAMADWVLVLDHGRLIRDAARDDLDHGGDLHTALYGLLTAQEGGPR